MGIYRVTEKGFCVKGQRCDIISHQSTNEPTEFIQHWPKTFPDQNDYPNDNISVILLKTNKQYNNNNNFITNMPL